MTEPKKDPIQVGNLQLEYVGRVPQMYPTGLEVERWCCPLLFGTLYATIEKGVSVRGEHWTWSIVSHGQAVTRSFKSLPTVDEASMELLTTLRDGARQLTGLLG